MSKRISIVIANEQKIYREGLKILLKQVDKVEIIGEASTVSELTTLVTSLDPDVVITNLGLGSSVCISWLRDIMLQGYYNILVTGNANDHLRILQCFDIGILGCVTYQDIEYELEKAVRSVACGEKYLSVKIGNRLAESAVLQTKKRQKSKQLLSSSEIEILKFICEDLCSKEIAERVHLSRRTVEGYRSSISRKIGVKGTAGIVRFAINEGFYNVNY